MAKLVRILSTVLVVTCLVTTGTAANGKDEACPGPPVSINQTSGVEQYDVDQVVAGTDVVACGLVGAIVLDGSIGVEVPAPGGAVQFDAFSATGDGGTLTVGVESDGTLQYQEQEDPPNVDVEAACDDNAHFEKPNRMQGGRTVYFNRSTTPNYLTDLAGVESTLENSMRAWPTLYNDCGFPDNVTVTMSWGGNSENASAVQYDPSTETTTCSGSGLNSVSVLSFGRISAGILGGTCRSPGNPSVGGDIKLNTYYSWTRSPSSGCSTALDLRSVTTHEAGHWWGMDHVAPASHPHLTMRGGGISSVRCNEKLRTLGRGDVIGMRALYP